MQQNPYAYLILNNIYQLEQQFIMKELASGAILHVLIKYAQLYLIL